MNNINTSIQAIQQTLEPRQPDVSPVSVASRNFKDIMDTNLDQVIAKQNEGDMAISKLNSGEAQNLHEVMIAVEEADLSLRMLVQMRNKALEAYNEILKMNI